MGPSIFLLGIVSLPPATAIEWKLEDDEATLLQVHTRVHTHPLPANKHNDPNLILESVRNMARHMTGQSPEAVNAAVASVGEALAQMTPLLEEEHAHAQNQIQQQLQEIQACHGSTSHGSVVVGNFANDLATITQCREAMNVANARQEEVCTAWTNHANLVSFPPCQLAGSDAEQTYSIAQNLRIWVDDAWPVMDSMRTACQEATTFATAETERCSSLVDQYEETFCQHQLSCTLLSACHDHEVGVYSTMISDSQVGMNARQNQYRAIKQAECIIDLMTEALSASTTIDDANLNSCNDDIDVSSLVLTFAAPENPAVCPSPGAGEPACPEVQLPIAWTGGMATALSLTSSSGDVYTNAGALQEGSIAWNDRVYTFHNVPSEMLGATYFQGPVKLAAQSELTFQTPYVGTLYIFSDLPVPGWPARDGGFANLPGWERLDGVTNFNHGGASDFAVWKREVQAMTEVVIPVTELLVGGVAFLV